MLVLKVVVFKIIIDKCFFEMNVFLVLIYFEFSCYLERFRISNVFKCIYFLDKVE